MLEALFTLLFTLEVIIRYFGSRQNSQSFWGDPLIWVDIVSIVPFVAVFILCEGNPMSDACTDEWTGARSLWYIELLTAFKIVRIFKISRVSHALSRWLAVRSLAGLHGHRGSLLTPDQPGWLLLFLLFLQHFSGTE